MSFSQSPRSFRGAPKYGPRFAGPGFVYDLNCDLILISAVVMLPTQEQVEDYLSSIGDYISTIPVPTLPNLGELAEKVLDDIRRFGPLPSLPQVVASVPGLGAFEVPAPPPPPPPPPSEPLWTRPWFLAAAGLGTASVGLMVAYRWQRKDRRRLDSKDRPLPLRELVGMYPRHLLCAGLH